MKVHEGLISTLKTENLESRGRTKRVKDDQICSDRLDLGGEHTIYRYRIMKLYT